MKGSKGQSDPSSTTAETLAEEHGVSEKTVKRAGKFAEEIDSTPEDYWLFYFTNSLRDSAL